MKLVGSLLHDNIHNRAAIVPILRGEAIVLYFEFLNSFHRRLVINVRGRTLALFRRAGERSVQANLSRSVALAIGNKVCAGWVRIVCSLTCCFRDAARQEYKSEHAA